jgi:hypothetical protein
MAQRTLFDPGCKLTLLLLPTNPLTNHYAELTATQSTTRGVKKVKPHILFSETVITIVIKLSYIMGTNFTKLSLFLHKV